MNLPAHSVQLDKIPNIKLLLLKAAFKQASSGDRDLSSQALPNSKFHIEQLSLVQSSIKQFNSVVCWNEHADFLHPCYLHTLAFPLHLKLLLLPTCPFPMLGLIHLSNQIKQLRPVTFDEKLSMVARFGKLNKHAKGWSFCIQVDILSSGEKVWGSESYYLSRIKKAETTKAEGIRDKQNDSDKIEVTEHLSANLGRRYAKVSGDFNPIHLSTLTAKLFGLKRHIMHGMWTKAFCLSQLQNTGVTDLSEPFEVNVEFKQPLYLPTQISCLIQAQLNNSAEKLTTFKVQSGNNAKTYQHLLGIIKTI